MQKLSNMSGLDDFFDASLVKYIVTIFFVGIKKKKKFKVLCFYKNICNKILDIPVSTDGF